VALTGNVNALSASRVIEIGVPPSRLLIKG
jgi:hypothetical protein